MTSEFQEYLKEIHSKHYMGTDDDMSDNFDTWLSRLDTSELIYYADDFKTLAEQSLVQRIISELDKNLLEIMDLNGMYSYGRLSDFDHHKTKKDILSLPILSTPKPKGDK